MIRTAQLSDTKNPADLGRLLEAGIKLAYIHDQEGLVIVVLSYFLPRMDEEDGTRRTDG